MAVIQQANFVAHKLIAEARDFNRQLFGFQRFAGRIGHLGGFRLRLAVALLFFLVQDFKIIVGLHHGIVYPAGIALLIQFQLLLKQVEGDIIQPVREAQNMVLIAAAINTIT